MRTGCELAQTRFTVHCLILSAFVFAACDNSITTDHNLTGKWVEEKSTTDTLSFEKIGDADVMVLSRGVISNGNVMRPKMDSGPYDYELLENNKIKLHWHLTSNSIYKTYYFKHSGNELNIEQFFENPVPGTILTFRKLK